MLIDEASRVEDDLLTAVTPMLATVDRGRLIDLVHTSWKKRMVVSALAGSGGRWDPRRGTGVLIPRISEGFLESERRSMPVAQFRQEYQCSFEEADLAVFSGDAENAIDPEREPLVLDVFSKWGS